MTDWNGTPYHSLDYELKRQFGQKVYKRSLESGMPCPNRDGTLGTGGCIFCSEGGAGDFAEGLTARAYHARELPLEPASLAKEVFAQIEAAKTQVQRKMPSGPKPRYIAYFQSYTNTYGPIAYLEPLFTAAIHHPDIAVLSIATRPDCLGDSVIKLLAELSQI